MEGPVRGHPGVAGDRGVLREPRGRRKVRRVGIAILTLFMAFAVFLVFQNLPALKRYLRMRRM
ncbi:DUF6893 family small protein [Actinocorallia aurantiaca]|uniref:DUF6893 family small protein n=1 Tax=Actinocorallia aurantiaca TaxID=46204 RepID=UPI003CD08E4A